MTCGDSYSSQDSAKLTRMTTNLGQSAGVWNSALGQFISSNHERVAEMIQDYNPNFGLVFIPEKDRGATDTKPYAILDSTPGRIPYIVRYISLREMEDPTSIIEWIFMGDLSKRRASDVFDRIQAREAAETLVALKEKEAQLEQDLEFANFVFGSRSKNVWEHNGRTYRK